MNDKELFERIRRDRTEPQVLAIIVKTYEQGPRSVGTKMLLSRDAIKWGTVGGGVTEQKCILEAKKVFEDARSVLLKIDNLKGHEDEGMVCNRKNDIYLKYIAPDDEEFYLELEKLEDRIREKKESVLSIELSTGRCKVEAQWRQDADSLLYQERFLPEGRVYIFGGGHVAQALVPLLSKASLSTVVIESRENFADRRLFPTAEEVFLRDERIWPEEIKDVGKQDMIIIMTHSHFEDYKVLQKCLLTRAGYIGMLAGKKKILSIFDRLRSEGFTENELAAVHTPIGLDIHAETPFEIAVSILAEIINVKNQ